MLLSIEQYAKKSGCTTANIKTRIKKKVIRLKMKKLPNKEVAGYIDTAKYPAVRIRKSGGGRKKKNATTLNTSK